jgi:penicillin-binding protein 1A
VRVFPVPEDIVFAKIDAETGLLPSSESQNTVFECFKEGTAPTKLTKTKNGFVDSTDDYFKFGM